MPRHWRLVAPLISTSAKFPKAAQVVIRWRQRPIFVFHRSKQTLDAMQSDANDIAAFRSELRAAPQAPYATNWHRSLKPEYGVLVGICTHLGCIPLFFPNPSATAPVIELAGRLFLSLSRLEIRSCGPRLFRCASAV